MERRLRRQESASSALGGGSLPRPPAAAATSTSAPVRQWDEYGAALEADHAELRDLFEKQRVELAGAVALLAEQQLRESQLTTLERELAQHDRFLGEVMDLIALADGSRPGGLAHRRDVNTSAANVKAAPAATMDAVRAALQKQQLHLQSLRRSEEGSRAALRALQAGSVASPSIAATAHVTNSPTKGGERSAGRQDCLVPGGAKELEAACARARSLERRLQAAEADARVRGADLARAEHTLKLTTASTRQTRTELEETRRLLEKQGTLLSATERRCHALERELRSARGAAVGSAVAARDTTSNSVGDKAYATTRHYRLFSGPSFADALRTDPEALREALLSDASAAVHVPVAFLTLHSVTETGALDTAGKSGDGAGGLGVGVEFDVKHNERLASDAVDVLLLNAAFPTVANLADRAAVAVRSTLQSELAELREVAARRESEAVTLRARVLKLDSLLQRRDAERASSDKDVGHAIAEAEATVKELYAALETQRDRSDALAADLATSMGRTQELEEQAAAAEARAVTLAADRTALHGQLARLRTEHAREVARLEEAKQAAHVDVCLAVFDVPNGGVPLPSADLAETAAMLTGSDAPAGAAAAFRHTLLCEAALATGTVPVRVTTCACTSTTAPAHLTLAFELAFYASPGNTAHARADIVAKLTACCFPAAMDFLRDRRALAGAAATAEAATKRLDTALSLSERKSALTVAAKADALIVRLRRAEAGLREGRDALAERDAAVQRAVEEAAEAADTLTALRGKATRLESALLEKQQQQERAAESAAAREKALLSQLQERDEQLRALQAETARVQREAAEGRHERERQEALVQQLTERVRGLESTAAASAAVAGKGKGTTAATHVGSPGTRAAAPEDDAVALRRQIAEMETDMADFARMQAALQGSLDAAQTELRAKTQDVNHLTQQLQRQQERERQHTEELQRLRANAGAGVTAPQPSAKERPAGGSGRGPHVPRPSRTSSTGIGAADSTAGAAAGLPVPPDEAAATEGERMSTPSRTPAAGGSPLSVRSTVRTERGVVSPGGSSRGGSGPPRIIKRSTNVFTRTSTTPTVAPAPLGPAVGGGSPAVIAHTAAAATGGVDAFVRSATATATATTTTRPRTVEAAPRLGGGALTGAGGAGVAGVPPLPLHRQESRAYLMSAAAVVKKAGSGRVVGGVDAVALTKERRHVSPVAGSGAAGGAAVSSRRPASPMVKAFQRSQSTLGSTAASASYVRTPSGYRRVNPS